MWRKEGKVIKITCDLCKVDDIKNANRLTLKDFTTGGVIVWDICPNCIPKMQDTLGIGRKFTEKDLQRH